MRHGLFGFGQAGRDGFAHPVELDDLVVAALVHLGDGVAGWACRCCGSCCWRRCCCGFWFRCRRGFGFFNVCLDDATMRAGAFDGTQVETLLRGDPAGQGRGKDAFAIRALWGGGGRGCCGGRGGCLCCGGFGCCCRGRCGCRTDVVSAFAVFQQHRDGGVDLDPFGALSHQDLANQTFVHGLELHRGLVGFDLGHDIAGRYAIALFDQPFGQRAFFHRGRQGGHQNFGCHVTSLPYA
mmetsp:Transcript_29037/g.55782  ORF Transcript_29037/g.55782 Transcript_29037/m.55782 type:complete len:238 (+) Transcript_29037:1200-1913(+)